MFRLDHIVGTEIPTAKVVTRGRSGLRDPPSSGLVRTEVRKRVNEGDGKDVRQVEGSGSTSEGRKPWDEEVEPVCILVDSSSFHSPPTQGVGRRHHSGSVTLNVFEGPNRLRVGSDSW